jgi:transposase
VASGEVIGEPHRRHRAVEFRKFLETVDKGAGRTRRVLDPRQLLGPQDTGHPTVAGPPSRFYLHFTPTYSSWLNLIERWSAELTEKWIRRGTHQSTLALESTIKHWLDTWNEAPRPFVWTKTADEILATLAGYLQDLRNR